MPLSQMRNPLKKDEGLLRFLEPPVDRPYNCIASSKEKALSSLGRQDVGKLGLDRIIGPLLSFHSTLFSEWNVARLLESVPVFTGIVFFSCIHPFIQIP